MVFVAYRPAWVWSSGPLVGKPLSWLHFQYGLKSIGREQLRQRLMLAQSVRMADVVPEDWVTYQRDMNFMTEVPRHVN